MGRWSVLTPVVGGRDDVDADGDEWETRMWRGEVTLEELGWGVKRAGGAESSGGMLERWCREI